jgi:hypothetical protein
MNKEKLEDIWAALKFAVMVILGIIVFMLCVSFIAAIIVVLIKAIFGIYNPGLSKVVLGLSLIGVAAFGFAYSLIRKYRE